MRKGEVMRPFRAPRSREGKTAAKASPTRQSPRRTGKPDTTGDSEGTTKLRVNRGSCESREERLAGTEQRFSSRLYSHNSEQGHTFGMILLKRIPQPKVVDKSL